MTAKKTSPEQDQELIKLYLNGIPPKILQKQFNIASSTFHKILKDNNIKSNQAKRYTSEEKLAMVTAYKNGRSVQSIAKEFNISESNVFKYCRDFNIPVRQPHNKLDGKFLSNQDVQNIINDYLNKISPIAIGQKYNLTGSSIIRIVRKKGIIRQSKTSNTIIKTITTKPIINFSADIPPNLPENYGTTKIVTINSFELNKDNVLSLSKEERIKCIEPIFTYYRTFGFPFPQYSDKALTDDWDKLVNTNTTNLAPNNILTNSNKMWIGNKIWKHFCPHYYSATNDSKKSNMYEAFHNDNILKKAISNRLGITYKETFQINGNSIKQAFRVGYLSGQVSVFSPVIAKFIYDKYTNPNDTVYDFSMGFGQRLLGALSSPNNLTYIGADPWIHVVPALEKISTFLNKSNSCQLNKIGAEFFCPENLHGKIDLAFSSPPYFNIEIYDNDPTQANFNRSYNQFINDWWLKVAQNIHKLLRVDGKLALNMKQNILDDMQKVLLDNGFEYIESIYIRSSRKHMKTGENYVDEPIAIFKKVKI